MGQDPGELRALLREAVRDAMDVGRSGGFTGQHPRKIGAVLSGGVDSSTITTLALELDPELPTFTGYYEGFDGAFDEREYARAVCGRNHHEILITPEDFVEHFDGMAAAAKPPYQGMGTFGQYMVAKYVSEQGVEVVFSGEGGDELFGGYARLIMVAGEEMPLGYENYKLPKGYPKDLVKALQYDYDRLPDLLAVDDQMCAAWGLTAVAPMTDKRIVDWALALPPEMRVAKKTLKAAVSGLLPQVITSRKDKKGMPIPLAAWSLDDPVRSFVKDRLGYLPDPSKPWDRAWFHEMIEKSKQAVPA